MFGLPAETVYLYGLAITGSLTLLLLLFQDVFAGFEGPDFLNPVLILSFFTVLCAAGFTMERLLDIPQMLNVLAAAIISFFIVTLFNIFILIPLSSAEESLSFSENDLKGRVGRIITSVPKDGFGEVLIEGASGSIAKPAVSFNHEPIMAPSEVLIIDVQKGVLYVQPHNSLKHI